MLISATSRESTGTSSSVPHDKFQRRLFNIVKPYSFQSSFEVVHLCLFLLLHSLSCLRFLSIVPKEESHQADHVPVLSFCEDERTQTGSASQTVSLTQLQYPDKLSRIYRHWRALASSGSYPPIEQASAAILSCAGQASS